MQKHQLEIDLTVLKELVTKYWKSEQKEKYFRSYTDKNGKLHNLMTTDLCLMTPKYALKGDGSKIETATRVLHDSGFAQVSEKVDGAWVNQNFAKLKLWMEKVDTTPPSHVRPTADNEVIEYPDDKLDENSIPF